MSEPDADWAEQRKRAISVHSAELARQQAAESEQAGRLLAEFVGNAKEAGREPIPLRARSYDSRRRYRTHLRGWYLTDDERFAVDEGGNFYILTVPNSVRSLITGAHIAPARPRLIIGEGGRDGERIALRELLDRVLRR
jgi:hypothetical protein